MSNEQIFYVYVYLDPRKPGLYIYGEYSFEYEPFYVGKGSDSRSTIHLYESSLERNCNRKFTNKIKKIRRKCGHDPFVISYKEQLEEQTAFDLEVSMISSIGRHDLKRGPLCNLTDGGEGTSEPTMEKRIKISISNQNRIWSDESKKKARESRYKWLKDHPEYDVKGKNNPMYGNVSKIGTHLSEETKKKISISNTKYSAILIEEAIRLRKCGLKYREISEKINVKEGTIWWWCKYNK